MSIVYNYHKETFLLQVSNDPIKNFISVSSVARSSSDNLCNNYSSRFYFTDLAQILISISNILTEFLTKFIIANICII